MQGAGFRVQGSGCRVQGAGCRVHLSALGESAHVSVTRSIPTPYREKVYVSDATGAGLNGGDTTADLRS